MATPGLDRAYRSLSTPPELGSDGGGGWFVVTDDGRVWLLPPGRIVDGRYEPPSGVSLEPVAGSVNEFVALLRDRAVAAASRT